MARTQIPGSQVADHSITDLDIANDAAILGSKISIEYSGYTAGVTASSESILGIDASTGPVSLGYLRR